MPPEYKPSSRFCFKLDCKTVLFLGILDEAVKRKVLIETENVRLAWDARVRLWEKKPTVLQSCSICVEMTSIYYDSFKLNSKKPVNAKRTLISIASLFRSPLLIPVISPLGYCPSVYNSPSKNPLWRYISLWAYKRQFTVGHYKEVINPFPSVNWMGHFREFKNKGLRTSRWFTKLLVVPSYLELLIAEL